jgi:DNA primase
MDVIGLYGGGVSEAVASCGTAFVHEQVRILRRHTDHVVVNFDPDNAGANATEKSINLLLEEGIRIRVLSLPNGLDPDEFIQEQGGDAYRDLLKKAPRYFDWLADRARARFDFRTAEGRVDALKFLLPSVQRLPDKVERSAVANDLASYLGLDPGLVLEQFRRIATDRSAPAKVKAEPLSLPANERLLLKSLLMSEQAREEVLPRLRGARFAEKPVSNAILTALVGMGSHFSAESLMARLEEKDRTLLAGLLFADEGNQGESDDQVATSQAIDCLRAMEVAGRDAEFASLKAKIASAEKAGNLAEALALSQQLSALGQPGRRRRTAELE